MTARAEPVLDMDDAKFEALYHQAVDLMLQHHPVVESQRTLIAAVQDVPEQRGFPLSLDLTAELDQQVIADSLVAVPLVGVKLSVPLVSPRARLEQAERELEQLRVQEQDTQEMHQTIEQLLRNLTKDIQGILLTYAQIASGEELIRMVESNRSLQLELTAAGVAAPESLWDLDERIYELRVQQAQLRHNALLEINRVARSYGGDQWQTMKTLLEQMAAYNR